MEALLPHYYTGGVVVNNEIVDIGTNGLSDVYDYAMYFLKHGHGTDRNTFDGNMKLQKLLVFANMVSLAERDTPLFNDEILAFEQGCVIEKVRLRHQNDFNGFMADSRGFCPEFSQEEYDILNLTISLFANLSARELSDLNHAFAFWKEAYANSQNQDGFKDKRKAVVSLDAMRSEIGRFKAAILAYRETSVEANAKEVINGITFYYDPKELVLIDDILSDLYKFSLVAKEKVYSVYTDNGSLVIY